MSKTKQPKGEGHKARIAVDATASVTVDGKTQDFSFKYDVTVTVEHIDYIVRQIAGGISKAADKIARNGVGSLSKAA